MTIRDGGESANDAGADYQQRVSALLLTYMIAEQNISGLFHSSTDLFIEQLAYQTADSIDDLVIDCANSIKLYLQIKRSIDFSILEKSDFYQVIQQFVQQHVRATATNESYLLATSHLASRVVRIELTKILESIRLNDLNFESNPLSKTEDEHYRQCYQLVGDIYKKQVGMDITKEEFVEFCKKVYVVTFDVEQDKPDERSAILLLQLKIGVLKEPELVWSLLIRNSLTYARSRQSISKSALNKIIDRYRSQGEREQSDTDDQFFAYDLGQLVISPGREVLLLSGLFENDEAYYVVELHRFAEDGSKKVRFTHGMCVMGHGSLTAKVLFRCATYKGIERLIQENYSIIKDKQVRIIPANDVDGADGTLIAQDYSRLCIELWHNRRNKLQCLYCGRAVSDNKALLVEIDDDENEPQVGLVHRSCLQPTYRVAGTIYNNFFEQNKHLRDFDVNQWVNSLRRGQGLLNGINNLKAGNNTGQKVIVWNPSTNLNGQHRYCVKINLEDGSCRYATQRQKVLRLSKIEAEEGAIRFNAQIAEAKSRNDPRCYSSNTDVYGTYSQVLSLTNDELCIEAISAEPTIYTEAIGRSYDANDNYYAPLIYLTVGENEDAFAINSHVVLLSSALRIPVFIDNWKKARIVLDVYGVNILKDDADFDRAVGNAFADGGKAIIDPMVDLNLNFVNGYPVQNMMDIVAQAMLKNSSK